MASCALEAERLRSEFQVTNLGSPLLIAMHLSKSTGLPYAGQPATFLNYQRLVLLKAMTLSYSGAAGFRYLVLPVLEALTVQHPRV